MKTLVLLSALLLAFEPLANENPIYLGDGIIEIDSDNVFHHKSHRRRKRNRSYYPPPPSYQYETSNICRNGYFYCTILGFGPIGAPCHCYTLYGHFWFYGTLSPY